MARQELEKVVAAQALEATKEVLQHLQKWAAQLEQKREQKPRELAQNYGRVRRLRDYLARSLGAPVHPVELNIDDDDCNSLASCCVFALQGIGMQLRYARDLASSDRAWLEEKRDNLHDLVLELATEEIHVIPSPGGPKPHVPLVRVLMNEVRNRTRPKALGADDTPQDAASAGEGDSQEEPTIQTGGWTGEWSGTRNPLPSTWEGSEVNQDSATSASDGLDATGAGTDIQRRELDRCEPDRRKRTRRAMDKPPADLESLESDLQEEEEHKRGGLALDARLVRDPRLRTMLVLDTRALERARMAKDYRLSAVHLCSVFESVVVDVALARRGELGLKGTPENWKLDEVIRDVLGQKFSSSDRASLYHLIACRNLIRPSIQLHNPIVVTQATLKKMVDFVQGMLIELGVSGSANSKQAK